MFAVATAVVSERFAQSLAARLATSGPQRTLTHRE
jgi:hypothetical protein